MARSRRHRSVPVGGRYRQVSLYKGTVIIFPIIMSPGMIFALTTYLKYVTVFIPDNLWITSFKSTFYGPCMISEY